MTQEQREKYLSLPRWIQDYLSEHHLHIVTGRGGEEDTEIVYPDEGIVNLIHELLASPVEKEDKQGFQEIESNGYVTNYRKTFDGRKIPYGVLDHQHLSNIYWYEQIFANRKPKDLTFELHELKTRFNGQILPYCPHLEFKLEIQSLIDLGMLRKTGKCKSMGVWTYVIYWKKAVIGYINSPEKIK